MQKEVVDLESLLEYNEIVRKMFANEEGFSVRKSYFEWNNEHTELTLRRYVCSRQGYCEEKYVKKEIKKQRPRDITRVGCPAKLVIVLDRNTGTVVCEEFNR